ncbi:MAG: UDP-N-acetylmuramate:L-alanine ligase [Candidatus Scalindua rubra]|uniref:UDP-N-acetylmuramate--L-alanine ligase n=1 Tax=Candidatus Scalindua rubra TaxID=1872076 RepID=A0A1E3XAW6_9BACT|nr:MAG: UDP-N-acetylmuramate:L-alanine ligase [Candidatus Scalindua rubra]
MFDTKGKSRYHLVGIGGVGMSALAQIVKSQGHFVSGSDRKSDSNQTPEAFNKLKSQGIKLYPQDGTGIESSIDFVVTSSAIEEGNPDLKIAVQRNIRVIKRAELLSSFFNDKHGIAIGGSNGKTTVCGMTSWILDKAGHDPTVVGGGYIKNYISDKSLGNAKLGHSDIIVIEADESDGSLINYMPKVSVITDLSKDHMTTDELGDLFSKFVENTCDTVIINEKCTHFIRINDKRKEVIKYGEGSGVDIRISQISCNPFGSRFEINGSKFEINIPGSHNVLNALASIAVAQTEGVSDKDINIALGSFKGIRRRMEIVGEKNGIKIIDDYAHNPRKIQAAIDAARLSSKRLIVVFQPHGYSPTKFLREGFISAFAKKILPADILFMPEIFYAGGTAHKGISSRDIIDELRDRGIRAYFIPGREDIITEIKQRAIPGDSILIMGARDDSLTDLCHAMLNQL